jgi:hypothetical protein
MPVAGALEAVGAATAPMGAATAPRSALTAAAGQAAATGTPLAAAGLTTGPDEPGAVSAGTDRRAPQSVVVGPTEIVGWAAVRAVSVRRTAVAAAMAASTRVEAAPVLVLAGVAETAEWRLAKGAVLGWLAAADLAAGSAGLTRVAAEPAAGSAGLTSVAAEGVAAKFAVRVGDVWPSVTGLRAACRATAHPLAAAGGPGQ